MCCGRNVNAGAKCQCPHAHACAYICTVRCSEWSVCGQALSGSAWHMSWSARDKGLGRGKLVLYYCLWEDHFLNIAVFVLLKALVSHSSDAPPPSSLPHTWSHGAALSYALLCIHNADLPRHCPQARIKQQMRLMRQTCTCLTVSGATMS